MSVPGSAASAHPSAGLASSDFDSISHMSTHGNNQPSSGAGFASSDFNRTSHMSTHGNCACISHNSISTLTADSSSSNQPMAVAGYATPMAPPACGNALPLQGVNGQGGMIQPHALDNTGQRPPLGMQPRVAAVLWEDEGSLCFQVEARGVSVARREDNHMINGTKLLNVAGKTRGQRDSLLRNEKVRHVVKIGPMHLRGVWIPYERALELANKEKITELLYPLFAYNIGSFLYAPANQSSISTIAGLVEKEQANKQGQLYTPSAPETPSVDRQVSRYDTRIPCINPTSMWFPPSPSRSGNQALADGDLHLSHETGQSGPESQQSVGVRRGTSHSHWKAEAIAEDEHEQTPDQFSGSSSESLHTEGSILSLSPSGEEDIQYEDWRAKKRDDSVVHIVNSLRLWLLVKLSGLVCMNGNGSTADNSSNNLPAPSSTVSPAQPPSRTWAKRPAHHSDKSNDDGHDSDDDRYKKKPKSSARDLVNPSFLLACPYYKHDPSKYSRQKSSCSGPGWATIHRLKEHLYRRHALPEHKCPRCCCIFKTQKEMSQHLLAEIRCEIREEPTPQGFNKDQENEIRLRRPFKHAASEVDHWNRIYTILFPAETTVPSPYYDFVTVEGQPVAGVPQADVIGMFRAVLHQFPILMHQRLTAEIDEMIETHLEHHRIVGIAHHVLHSLMGNCGIPPVAATPASAPTLANPGHATIQSPPLAPSSAAGIDINNTDADLPSSVESIDWDQLMPGLGSDMVDFENDSWTYMSFLASEEEPYMN